MATRYVLLSNANLGSRIAEDEVDDLQTYFVETSQWQRLLNGDVDIVFGAKGAGKSALYSLLVATKEKLRLDRRTMFLAAENPRGTPAFRDLTTAPPLSEEQFRGLWKLYFLSIAAGYLRHHLTVNRSSNINAAQVCDMLADSGLLAPNVTLLSKLRASYEYLRALLPSLEGGIVDPNSGIEFKGKITLGEPSSAQRGLGHRSLDELLSQLNTAYQDEKITCWLVLDRLDVAFSDTPDLEGNALRSLFRTYLDMASLGNIRVKIFLRDDIWRKIVGAGFREASHVTRTMTISWDQHSLMNLLVRRLASNIHVCDHYGVDPQDLMANRDLQHNFFFNVFPDQVDVGQSKPTTIGWMISRTADGSKSTTPRELIHLLNETRDEQLKRYQLGNADPEDNQLFDKLAVRAALPAVSKVRYEQTLCAEHPGLKPYLDKLEGEKTQHTIETLERLWRCSRGKSAELAEKLVDAGFFERRGSKDSPNYWVPFLYRDALNMVQGAAE